MSVFLVGVGALVVVRVLGLVDQVVMTIVLFRVLTRLRARMKGTMIMSLVIYLPMEIVLR